MKALIITPLFDGIIPKIFFNSKSEPVGMPAVYKFQKFASAYFKSIYIINIFDINNRLIPKDKKIWKEKKVVKDNNIINIQIYLKFSKFLQKLDLIFPTSRLIGAVRMLKFFIIINALTVRINPDFLYTATMLGFISGLISYFHKIPSLMRGYGTTLGTELNPGNLKSKKYFLKNIMEMYPYLMHRNILMTNDGTRGIEIAKALSIPNSNFHFWLNGIDKNIRKEELNISKFLEKYNIPVNKFIIATVSRVDDWKRLDRIVNAMKIITCKNENIHLVLAGDGQLYPEIDKLVLKLGLQNNITMTGAISHQEALSLINGCKIFISLYDLSNLCNPVLEALLLGKCIISINDGSLEGIIKNSENGFLVNKENAINESSNMILELYSDLNKLDLISFNAKKTAEKLIYSWEDRLSNEISLIMNIIKENKYSKLYNYYKRVE